MADCFLTARMLAQQYLVESIRRFPEPAEFSRMIREAGFSSVTHRGLTHGVVNIHSGMAWDSKYDELRDLYEEWNEKGL